LEPLVEHEGYFCSAIVGILSPNPIQARMYKKIKLTRGAASIIIKKVA
jgi:hypothetical protein